MIKTILDRLISDQSISSHFLTEKLTREPVVHKYFLFFSAGIFLPFVTILVLFFVIYKFNNVPPPPTYKVNVENQTKQRIVTVPFPHQSIKSIQSWLEQAIMTAYSFSFLNFDEQVKRARLFFTPEGYTSYLQSLEKNNIRASVVNQNLVLSTIPLGQPILINSGAFGETVFWRFRVPVLISYLGGVQKVNQRFMVEVLILRVPSHKNHLGLGIAEFIMVMD